MNQDKLLELKQDQLFIQREGVREKIRNLQKLDQELSAKIERLSRQREIISQSRKVKQNSTEGPVRDSRISNSSIFNQIE